MFFSFFIFLNNSARRDFSRKLVLILLLEPNIALLSLVLLHLWPFASERTTENVFPRSWRA